SRAESFVVCVAAARTRRLWSQLRIFGPRLHYEIGLKRFDDIACCWAGFARRKSGNVVTVPVGRDDGMKVATRPLFDVRGDIQQARLWHSFGNTSRAKIDQDVPLRFSAVLKTDEKAVTESDVVGADRRAGGRRRHRNLLSHLAHAVQFSELRLRAGGRSRHSWFVEETRFP